MYFNHNHLILIIMEEAVVIISVFCQKTKAHELSNLPNTVTEKPTTSLGCSDSTTQDGSTI